MKYDPYVAPDPKSWLDLSPQERIDAILGYHQEAGVQAPGMQAHTLLHAVVEGQLAVGQGAVQRALDRLVAGGLDRHEAIHAIGFVLVEHTNDPVGSGATAGAIVSALNNPSLAAEMYNFLLLAATDDAYFQKLESMTASDWKKRFQVPQPPTMEPLGKDASYDNCPMCYGTGMMTCMNCQGSGSKTISSYSPYGMTTMRSPCVACAGKGRMRCTRCRGTRRR